VKTVYLHIGMHKTATTAIQVCLRENATTLAARGYMIPRAGVSGTTHNNIAFDIRNLPRFDAEKGGVDDLVDEVVSSDYEKFIVSAEALDYLTPEQIEELRKRLSSFEVRIIVFLRRQVEWLQSEWSELVKLRSCQEEFTQWIRRVASNDRRLHYFGFLEEWSEVFGKDDLRVRVYEKDRHREKNVFFDFLEACGVDGDVDWVLAPRVNVSPSIKTLEVIRSYVRHFSDVLKENRLLYRCKRIVEYGDLQGWNDTALHLIDRELFTSIHAMFKATNDRVANAYLNKEELFASDFEDRPITEFHVADMDTEELLRLFAYLES